MELLRKKTSHGLKVRRNYSKSLKIYYSSNETLDGAPNKRRAIIAKFLNFKDKQEVLSEYKARKL